jgi:hypothetical protein
MSSIAGTINVLEEIDPLFKIYCKNKKNEHEVGKGNLQKIWDEWDEYMTRVLKSGIISENPETLDLRVVYRIAKKHGAKSLMTGLEDLIEKKIMAYRDSLEKARIKLEAKSALGEQK